MRPRLLEMTAIGPFAETVRIDFDALSEYGLFHIHGRTGAGKTSLLDGLTFALYGKGTGQRAAGSMRSQHSEMSAEASATLEFTAQGVDWRVVRKPPQTRGRTRGKGLTEISYQKVELLRSNGNGWDPYVSGPTEVDAEITRLVGLNHKQFTQVAVLPQGAFAEALQANSTQREGLLRALFGTERFGVYAEQLQEQSKDARRKRDSAAKRIGDFEAQLRRRVLAGGLADQFGEAPITIESVQSVLDEANDRVATTSARMGVLRDAAKAAQKRMEDERLRTARYQQRTGAMSKLAALEAERDEVDVAQAELGAAMRVAPIVPAVERARASTQRLSLLEQKTQTTTNDLEAFLANADGLARVVQSVLDKKSVIDTRASIADVEALRSQLAHDIEQMTSARRALDAAERLEDEAVSLSDAADELEEQVADLVEKQRQGAEQLEVLRAQASRVEKLRADLTLLDGELAALDGLSNLRNEHQALRELWLGEREKHVGARDLHAGLVERRIRNMASELAADLTDGQECPVCGACEHPSKASAHEAVDPNEIEAAAALVNKFETSTEKAKSRLEAIDLDIKQLETLAGNSLIDGISAQSKRLELASDLDAATTASAELSELSSLMAAIEPAITSHRAELGAARAKAVEAAASAKASHRHAAELFDGDPTPALLSERHRSLDLHAQLIVELKGYESGLAELETATGDAERDLHHAEEVARQHDVASLEEVESAMRNPRSIDALRHRVDAWNQQTAAMNAVLADPEVAAVTEAPDLGSAQREVDEASAALEETVAANEKAKSSLLELQHVAQDLERAQTELSALDREVERIATLADMCRGAYSGNRMSLERYVLAAHLEEVAGAASKRLASMTEGRYTLRHSDQKSGPGASGLALLVRDSYTGSEREVNTLSGGETFLAALSFALGLSDVVRAHAGGIEIDVLFIDEGFGQLDPDFLELAMAHLEHVRAGGRVIGLISHVSSLRERIPVGLEVVRGARGSTVQVCSAEQAMPA